MLEPAYKNKYPPLGLMKIASFHREKGDLVFFCKGFVRSEDQEIEWDRIYITTLFTFEWAEAKKTINHAINLAKEDQSRIFVGGIAATLMPEVFLGEFPNINIVTGLLNEPGKLKHSGDECIDTMAPDYSILDQIKAIYEYPANDAYFAYTTRGCGMNCSFCAVKTLEPIYKPYISIKQQIEQVIERSGEKRNLLLMDNNVLKSPALRQIVDEIKELGFAKGAKYVSPRTKKTVQRVVDFNQGLDAKLLTQDKANMLGELELDPVRIAFDHIEDKELYTAAIERCIRAGLRDYSNYILYNSEKNSSWKGKEYTADTPQDLYNRLMLNIELQESHNETVTAEEDKIRIYSFPMRYIPLQSTERGFVGHHWNKKYLRAVQAMLTPTQGKGVSGRSFFTAAFGEDADDFMRYLVMPEYLLIARGHWVETKRGETDVGREIRREEWEFKNRLLEDWKARYAALDNEAELVALIAENRFTADTFTAIHNEELKKLYLYYFPGTQLAGVLADVNDTNRQWLIQFLSTDGQLLCEYLERSLTHTKPSTERLFAYVKAFGHGQIADRYCVTIQTLSITNQRNGIVLKPAFDRLFARLQSDYTFWHTILRGEKPELTKAKADHAKMSLFYCNGFQIFDLFNELSDEDLMLKLRKYLVKDEPVWLEYLTNLIYEHLGSVSQRFLGYFKLVGLNGVTALLTKWWDDPARSEDVIVVLERIFSQLRCSYADTALLRLAKSYYDAGVLMESVWQELYRLAIGDDYLQFKMLLLEHFDTFRDKCLCQFSDDAAGRMMRRQAEQQLNVVYTSVLSRLL
ncbi:MAG: Radical domain protein [Clostridiales bacterium]|nr:Radical domain protein [Clostridiales bacterium]